MVQFLFFCWFRADLSPLSVNDSLYIWPFFTIVISEEVVGGYCISFCCPSIESSLVGNVLLLVFGFRMLHFCKLVVIHFLTSNVCELI